MKRVRMSHTLGGMSRRSSRPGSAVMACTSKPRLMGAAIYLALVGGGVVAAIALSYVLRGIKLI